MIWREVSPFLLTELFPLFFVDGNSLLLLLEPVFLLALGTLTSLFLLLAQNAKTFSILLDLLILLFLLFEKIGCVFLETSIDILHAFNEDIEFNVFSFHKLLGHLQATAKMKTNG